MPEVLIRPAGPDDVPALLDLVVELAVYEREPDAVAASAEQMTAALFPATGAPAVFALVAETTHPTDPTDPTGGKPVIVGMAIWYLTYSTWLGRHGIWLEDLFVSPARRGGGAGRALLTELARIATERGYGRLEWWVLRWNTPSIGFYESLGAEAMDEWAHYRLDGDALAALAVNARPA